jgi:hypothetical protein
LNAIRAELFVYVFVLYVMTVSATAELGGLCTKGDSELVCA